MHFSLTNRISFTIALSLYLSTLEALLPHPLFLRYGFAYVALLVLSDVLTFKEFIISLFFKAIISALFSLTLFSPMFTLSVVSSFFSGIVIWSLRNVKNISHIGVSILSSFFSNAVQLYLVSVMLYGKFTLFLTPVVLFVGLVSSIVVGVISNVQSKHIHCLFKDIDSIKNNPLQFKYSLKGKTITRIFISLLFMVVMIFVSSFFTPRGEVIFELGFLKITTNSIRIACIKSIVVVFIVLLSLIISFMSLKIIKKSDNQTMFSSIWNYYIYFIAEQKIFK